MTEKNSNIALSVKNLKVELNSQLIVDDLSFTVKKGETLIVLGPNGAGKTTLLRAILGILPYQGTVTWSVKNISYLPPKELMQTKEIIPLTVADFFNLKNVNKQKILESIASVGLPESVYRERLAYLSTGQFQRLEIAWALVDEPDMLIFDEPTSGIDIGGTDTIYSLLHKFWEKQNLSIIMVTHDLSIVWEHADNVLCLNKVGMCYGTPNHALTPETIKKLYGAGVKYYKHGGGS